MSPRVHQFLSPSWMRVRPVFPKHRGQLIPLFPEIYYYAVYIIIPVRIKAAQSQRGHQGG